MKREGRDEGLQVALSWEEHHVFAELKEASCGWSKSPGDQDEKILEGEAGARSGGLRSHILYSICEKIRRFLSRRAFQGHWDNVRKGHVLVHGLQITGKHISLWLGSQAAA